MKKNLNQLLKKEANNYFKRNIKKLSLQNLDNNFTLEGLKVSGINPKKILEIGCFNGYRLEQLRQHYLINKRKVKCFGIDLSRLAIKDGKKKFPSIKLFELSSMNILNMRNQFDLIICDFLYLLDRELIFEQFDLIYKSLNKDGYLVISDFDPMFPHFNINSNKKNFYSFKVDYSNFLTSSYLFKKIYFKNWTTTDKKTKYLDKNLSIAIYKKINFNKSFPKNI